jgi:ABC-type multidrug transport system ATPase subunit
LSEQALVAENLTARYPGQPAASPALADVDLQLGAGERLLLLGPNGAGKSTFIRVFSGLMRATHGRAQIMDRPARRARDLVGIVSHATYLYDELTASENLRFYAELYGVAEPARRAMQLLEQVGLAQLAHEQVGRLSRGQQQRVAIARALVHDPPLLLLDEPDTGLDLAAFGLLEALATSGQRSVVLTTHNLAAGLRLGTRVAVLSHGRVVHQQTSVSLSDAPALTDLLQRLATA